MLIGDIEEAEREFNKCGYSIAGICYDAPLVVSLALNDFRILILKEEKSGEMYWVNFSRSTEENWLN